MSEPRSNGETPGVAAESQHRLGETTPRRPAPNRTQRQDSTYDQMLDVVNMAKEAGCYDAADWIIGRWPALTEEVT